jgi:hypothetical protein
MQFIDQLDAYFMNANRVDSLAVAFSDIVLAD